MPEQYSQSKALWAVTRASFKAIFANPSAIIFSILFPIIFILIFGAFGGDGVQRHRIAIANDSDTQNVVYDSLVTSRFVRVVVFDDTAAMREDLEKGNLSAIV